MTDSVTLGSLLGIQLWDPWAPSLSPSSVRVRAQHSLRPGRWQTLSRSASNCHVLLSIPHLVGRIDASHQEQILVEVDDPERRILPLRFEPLVPCDTFWFNVPAEFSNLAPAFHVPTFAHPARTCPAGWICLRADLRRESDETIVPWALMEVRLGSDLMTIGMSSNAGSITAAFPAPPDRIRPASMPSSEPFDTKRWIFDLTFRWSSARIGNDSPSLTDLASMPIVAALSAPSTQLTTLECSTGETIMSTSSSLANSSFLLIQA